MEQTRELEWFPTYPDKILSSVHWKKMTDFQRGWYWQLLLLMTRSKPLGYLRFDDGHLWTLAGAHSRQYWDIHSALVLACFKVAEFDGHQWIYNQKLLDVLKQQQDKHDKAVARGKRKNNSSSASSSYSLDFEKIWEECVWEKVSKKTAVMAFERAVQAVMKQQNGVPDELQNRGLAVGVLAEAMREFAKSDAAKENGLFEGYKPPYPASWLNGQRYLDDRKKWYRSGASPAQATEEPRPKDRVAPISDCPACSGTGWKPVQGNRVGRCNCRMEKEARDAAHKAAQ